MAAAITFQPETNAGQLADELPTFAPIEDMEANEVDWQILERLRARFISNDSKAVGSYWQDENDLAHYHAFFAARIGWKWDNALDEAQRAGFRLRSRILFDWGCGSGIATLKVLERFGADAVDEVRLWDHSLLACRFAQQQIQAAYPKLKVEIADGSSPVSTENDVAVLVSHALNELSFETQDALTAQIREAAQILFVEPGDHATSRLLVKQREDLSADFDILAPCTHSLRCPLLEAENGRHWCHFFGKPPIEAFTEGVWASFAQTMEIDLRSLPYSFLALNHKRLNSPSETPPGSSRLIGRPQQFKGYTRLLSCDSCGLRDLELQKRDDKSLWKSLKKGKDGSLYRWGAMEAGRLSGGQAL